MTIIGIDPGKNGGICIIDGYNKITLVKMPETMTEIYLKLKEIIQTYPDAKCYLEDVGNPRKTNGIKSIATFARHNGHLEMALFAAEIPTEKVTPQKWQKFYSNTIGNSTDAKREDKAWKKVLKDEAQRRFPSIRVTDWSADALLIATYGKAQ